MRLLLFVPQLCSGGAQQVAVLLSSGLVALGCEVHIVAADLKGELLGRVDPGCYLIDLKSKKPIRAGGRLAKIINSIKPDSIICFGVYTGIAAAISGLNWKHRPLFIIRNENNLHIDWQQATVLNRIIGPPLSRWAANRAHVVAVSQSLAQPTADYLRLPIDQVTTILNPVFDDTIPVESNNCSVLHPWLRDSACPVFVAMGRLEHQKGFDVLINAFALVRRQAQAQLVIFGRGSLQAALQAQIDALGMQEVVTLAGHTDHAMVQMRASHAFVLSSRFEGFGLVLVEALHAGAQVIATRCDYGPAEILEGGRYGTLVPVDDHAALAAAMLDSLDDRVALPRPLDAWFERFTATAAAHQHIALIESLRGR